MQNIYLLVLAFFVFGAPQQTSAQCSPQLLNCPDTIPICDLDSDGIRETVIDSDNPPDAGMVRFNNAFNPNFTGGMSLPFDHRPLLGSNKWRFSLTSTAMGDSIQFSLQWTNDATPGFFEQPELPYGSHLVRWEVTDASNAVQVCEKILRIQDCQAPTLSCINGLSVHILPTKKINLYATDFLLNAEDNATPANRIKLGIRKQGAGSGFPVDSVGNAVTNLLFTCNELGIQGVEIWIMDAAGNSEFCETSVQILDNMGICSTPPNTMVQVCSSTPCQPGFGPDELILEFEVVHPLGPPTTYFTSGACGSIFASDNAEVTITPSNDTDPLNGISSFDISLLNQYIQSGTPFASPYQWIAADANNDSVIDSLDVLECKNLLLGIYTELPFNSAWRFVDKNYVFPVPNPLSEPFPESITVNIGNLPAMSLEFVAVKICDVSCLGLVNVLDPASEKQLFVGSVQPNPTRGGTLLLLQLMRSETVLLEVLDQSGRLLFRTETYLPAGPASLEIPASALPQSGMYIWRLRTGEAVQAGKLVRE